ncbi:CDP-glycerol glycerophosphotransferase family protein [Populibacterium corticicola]|uniref:CDP-glycerol glycerophosphotransferase family protein n=1 Tax=Populibacterium corticicola TaxID=1812826 RepID=A0ABW5XD80_9MICO
MTYAKQISRFLGTVGGYALVGNLAALVLIVVLLISDTNAGVVALCWLIVATFEFVTRGHVRRIRIRGLKTVVTAKDDVSVLGSGYSNRIIGLGAVLVAVADGAQLGPGEIVLLVLVVTAVVLEAVTSPFRRKAGPTFANIPWHPELPQRLNLSLHVYLLNVLAIAAALATSVNMTFGYLAGSFALLSLGMQIAMMLRAVARMRSKQRFEAQLHDRLEQYAPEFYFYWDAPADTVFQAAMWLPYLERLGRNFCIILRNATNLETLAAITKTPILVRSAMAQLDDVIVPSLKVTFYANNAIRNAHFARFLGITHIQLNHGDSDKPPSYNPVMRMYDRNFVAGPAAVERYSSRGIETAPNFFEIVGRPQIEGIEIVDVETSDGAPKTVLYAPTWAGFMADSAVSSLPIGPHIVQQLVERGHRVLFRPHPHARKNAVLRAACDEIEKLLVAENLKGGQHLHGAVAETEMTIFDCFNASDALISDVSSVVPDYLYSGKPFAVVAMGFEDIEAFYTENPVARAGYVIVQDGSNIPSVYDDLLDSDPLSGRRQEFKIHYLGDFVGEGYSSRFTEICEKYLS